MVPALDALAGDVDADGPGARARATARAQFWECNQGSSQVRLIHDHPVIRPLAAARPRRPVHTPRHSEPSQRRRPEAGRCESQQARAQHPYSKCSRSGMAPSSVWWYRTGSRIPRWRRCLSAVAALQGSVACHRQRCRTPVSFPRVQTPDGPARPPVRPRCLRAPGASAGRWPAQSQAAVVLVSLVGGLFQQQQQQLNSRQQAWWRSRGKGRPRWRDACVLLVVMATVAGPSPSRSSSAGHDQKMLLLV